MSLVVVAAALGLLALPGGLVRVGRRLPPAEWARVAAVAAWLGLVALRVGLFLFAFPQILRAAGVDGVADACHRLLSVGVPGNPFIGLSAAALFVVVSFAGWRGGRANRRAQRAARVEPWLGDHNAFRDHEVVVLPTSADVAYAVGGLPPQVVVSRGLIDSLAPDELDAVLRHESCHLRRNHGRYLALAATIEAATFRCRVGRRTAAAIRVAVERWADETVATTPEGRAALRRALLKCTDNMMGAVAAFCGVATVWERLEALDSDPPRGDWRTRLPLFGLAGGLAAATLAAVVAADGQHGLLVILGHCPT